MLLTEMGGLSRLGSAGVPQTAAKEGFSNGFGAVAMLVSSDRFLPRSLANKLRLGRRRARDDSDAMLTSSETSERMG